MSTAFPPRHSPLIRETPEATPLHEATGQVWLLNGRVREERNSGRRVKALAWLSLAGIGVAASAGFFTGIALYELQIRLFVTAGAAAMMLHALHARRYAVAVVFGVLALLYNPAAPLFSFSGEWQRAVIGLSGLPFIASLTGSHAEATRHA